MAGQKGSYEAFALLGHFHVNLAYGFAKQKNPDMVAFRTSFLEGVGNLAYAASRGNMLAIDTITGTLRMGWNQGDLGDMLREKVYAVLTNHLQEIKTENSAESNYTLGIFAMRGICMHQDFALARNYLSRSAEMGNEKAKQELNNPLLSDDDED